MKRTAVSVALFLSSSLFAQTDIADDVRGLVSNLDGTTREVRLIGRAVFAIDAQVSELLVSLAQQYKFTYEIPADANPAALLTAFPGTTAGQRADRGYGFLQESLAELQSATDGKGDSAAVKELATETALLTWALKGQVLLDAIDYGNGGTKREGNAVGPQGTIEDWDGSASLLGGGGNWSGTFEGWMNRRRQAELVGLEYPNADLGSWLLPGSGR